MIQALKQKLYMMSGTFRGIFFIIIIFCVIGIIIYTQTIVRELRHESREIVEFTASMLQRTATDQFDSKMLGWIFENITRRTTFPLVLTQADGEPASWKGLNVPENDRSPETINEVKKIMKRMAKENDPVPIKYKDTVINYLYYGDSKNIIQLSKLPYITIATMGLLVLLAFIGFNSIKKSEQRFIWVGMAKETAHQLGTPISSLMRR